ncbi:MAG: cytochrome-c peroxidase [Pseudomonadota bacterium]|mgnify:CR=1 FL=1|nr:MAG: cytochrome C peroxidase [Pseudomonadota bacterium]
MRKLLTLSSCIAALLIAAPVVAQTGSVEELRKTANTLFKPIPPKVTEVRGQKITQEQIDLGRMLYFDPRLSRSHIISCNTCHAIGTGGADNVPTSVGHGWQKGPRNAPTTLNAVFNVAQFWDGRAKDLAEQATGPVEASVEMNNTPDRVIATLKSIPQYVEAFKRAFPGSADPVTYQNMARAIEAFETTLITPNSRFDQFLLGKNSLDKEELEGLQLFISKGCAACHSGINLGGQAYFPFGVVERPGGSILPEGDKGRFTVTKTATDEYVFRAAPLRNVALTAPYFHSGQVWDLEEAVHIMGSAQLGQTLNNEEARLIATFLRTLTGEQPKIEYPILPPSTIATPKPE